MENIFRPQTDGKVDTKLAAAAASVAKSMGGRVKRNQSTLLTKLQEAAATTKKRANLSDVLSGLKVHKDQAANANESRTEESGLFASRDEQKTFHRYAPQKFKRSSSRAIPDEVGLFSAKPLEIFQHTGSSVDDDGGLWRVLERRDLELTLAEPPRNGWEEMMRWTDEGKMWHFPINNEQGMEDETQYTFDQHVFLDPLIADFPQSGPVRHFMELVVAGLASNHWLTVSEKKEHVDWFREYFKSKQEIIDDALRVEDDEESQADISSQS